MNIFQILFLLSVVIIYGFSMDPARKGNENFPERNGNGLIEEAVDSEYPGINVHYNFEPKDWKHIELIEKRNSDFLKEIKNEARQMTEDKLKIHHVLNIQRRQIEELTNLITSIQSGTKGNMSIQEQAFQYLRNGNTINLKKNQNVYKLKETFDEIGIRLFENSKFERPNNFYFKLAEQWAT